MKRYLIIAKDLPLNITEADKKERETLLAYAPHCAVYGDFLLISMMSEDVDTLVKKNPANKIDWSTEDWSQEELLQHYVYLSSVEPSGKVLILSQGQGKTLQACLYGGD